MIAVKSDNSTFFFKTDMDSLRDLYCHISDLLEDKITDAEELHEIASNVESWAEILADVGDEYDELSEYGIYISCVESYSI